jgi:hypothetical protein
MAPARAAGYRSRMKIMTVLGTRPEVIRLSAIIPLLDAHADHVLVHTGRSYDDQPLRGHGAEQQLKQSSLVEQYDAVCRPEADPRTVAWGRQEVDRECPSTRWSCMYKNR